MVNEVGHKKAVASFVLGVISLIGCFTGLGAIISVILGIIGICCASTSKKNDYTGGMRTAGLVCSIIGLVIGGIIVLITLIAGGAIIGVALS